MARRVIQRNPELDLETVDLIALLWLFSNPHQSNRRQLSSLKYILKMSEELQSPVGRVMLTDDELTQLVLGSLRKLQKRGLLYLSSAGVHYIRGTLTEKGVKLVEESINTQDLRRVIQSFGNNP